MGQTKSKNSVESVTNSMMEVVNSNVNSNVTSVDLSQAIKIVQGDNSTISDTNFKQKQAFVVNSETMQSATNRTTLENNLDQQAKLSASATNTAFNFSPNSTQANNVTKYVTDIKNSIYNSFTNTCSNSVNAEQLVDIEMGNNATIRNVTFDQDQSGKLMVKCIQNTQSYTEAVNNLQQYLDSNSSSTVSSPITWIIIGIVVIVVVIAIIIGLIIFFSVRNKNKTSKTGGSFGKTSDEIDLDSIRSIPTGVNS